VRSPDLNRFGEVAFRPLARRPRGEAVARGRGDGVEEDDLLDRHRVPEAVADGGTPPRPPMTHPSPTLIRGRATMVVICFVVPSPILGCFLSFG